MVSITEGPTVWVPGLLGIQYFVNPRPGYVFRVGPWPPPTGAEDAACCTSGPKRF